MSGTVAKCALLGALFVLVVLVGTKLSYAKMPGWQAISFIIVAVGIFQWVSHRFDMRFPKSNEDRLG